jgi:hypothetical protein
MTRHTGWIVLCFPLVLVGCSSSTGPRVEKLQEALAQSKVTLKQSVASGEASLSGGMTVKAALLVESEPEYSVRALGQGNLHDIRVDIVSGSVTSSTDLGQSSDPCPGSIPVADAITIAEETVGGSAVKIQPDDDDQCLREVQVLSGSTLWEVKLARDGRVLEVEKADGD